MNRLIAHLIPESDIVMQGDSYNARVILAAEDTTHATSVYVNGNPLAESDRGQFSIPASRPGTYPVEGYLEMEAADGTILRHPFSSNYTVIEPMASIAPALTSVLYAGIDNEISISVPGVAPGDVQATMTNGSLNRRGNQWIARPSVVGKTYPLPYPLAYRMDPYVSPCKSSEHVHSPTLPLHLVHRWKRSPRHVQGRKLIKIRPDEHPRYRGCYR